MKLGLSLGLPLALFLPGCAPTYNPQNLSYEQLSTRTLGNDPTPVVYRVFFSPPHALLYRHMPLEDSALLQSADLTLEKGGRYFVILRHEDAMYDASGSNDESLFDYIYLAYIIRVLQEKPSAPEIVAYDAAFVRQSLLSAYALETVGPPPNQAADDRKE